MRVAAEMLHVEGWWQCRRGSAGNGRRGHPPTCLLACGEEWGRLGEVCSSGGRVGEGKGLMFRHTPSREGGMSMGWRDVQPGMGGKGGEPPATPHACPCLPKTHHNARKFVACLVLLPQKAIRNKMSQTEGRNNQMSSFESFTDEE